MRRRSSFYVIFFNIVRYRTHLQSCTSSLKIIDMPFRYYNRRWRNRRCGNRRYNVYLGNDWDDDQNNKLRVVEYGSGSSPDSALSALNNFGSDVLTVKNVDLNIAVNTVDHKTDKYDINDREHLVVRRGQSFTLKFNFNKAFEKKKDDLKFVFEFGDNPEQTKGSKVNIVLSDRDEPKKWGAKIEKESGNSLTVKVFTPPTSFVGEWKLGVEVMKKDDDNVTIFKYKNDRSIIVLFNPWNQDDIVYQRDNKEEYVLNETGKIYVGSLKEIFSRPWNFGQFQEDVLECALYLLEEKSGMQATSRGDPVKVVRKISSLVNAQDNDGILCGRWDGNYSGGTSPTKWRGSVKILQEYFGTKHSVMYGQCWVFSGVVTTLCRALGIPARSVTNFSSAHDTDGSVSIDRHWSCQYEPLESSDSVWNFHVWNEVWMRRPDLFGDFGGWQAIDGTPQEASDGVYCCGPCPLKALKVGDVNEPYDGKFIFAEVNADRIDWIQKNGEYSKIRVDKSVVGKFISTKAPIGSKGTGVTKICDDADREDITLEYKYKEGSPEERKAVKRANLTGKEEEEEEDRQTTVEDVSFDLEEKNKIYIGQDYHVKLRIQNKSSEPRTLQGCISTSSCFYTGVLYKPIKKEKISGKVIKPGQDLTLDMAVSFEEYRRCIIDQCQFKLSCSFTVMETEQQYTNQDDFQLLKPKLQITVPSEVKVGQDFKAKVTFRNPLNVTLMRCHLQCEGPALWKAVMKKERSIDPKEEFNCELQLTAAKKPGMSQLIFGFDSDELDDVCESCDIMVKS